MLQVAYQSNVNDVIKLIIENCDFIFDKDDPPGPVYARPEEVGYVISFRLSPNSLHY